MQQHLLTHAAPSIASARRQRAKRRVIVDEASEQRLILRGLEEMGTYLQAIERVISSRDHHEAVEIARKARTVIRNGNGNVETAEESATITRLIVWIEGILR